MDKYSEREYTANRSIQLALNLLKNYGIAYTLKRIPTLTDSLNTYRFFLKDKLGRIDVGNGKGLNDEAIASAIYESLEHYFYDTQEPTVKELSLSDLIMNNGNISADYWYSLLTKKHYSGSISCYSYKKLGSSSTAEFYHPAFLTNINFNGDQRLMQKYPQLKLYSTNDGCASGTNQTESLVHAISETIERDSISQFIAKSLIGKVGAKQVRFESLPDNLLKLFSEIRDYTSSTIIILDIKSDLEIPSYLVYTIDRNVSKLPIFGAGSSLNENYALSRALTECLQSYQLMNRKRRQEELTILSNFQKFPAYLNAITFASLNKIPSNYNETCVNFAGPEDELQALNVILKKHGITVLYRNLTQSESLSVDQVVIPSLDGFNLILEGLPIMPGKRTQIALQEFI